MAFLERILFWRKKRELIPLPEEKRIEFRRIEEELNNPRTKIGAIGRYGSLIHRYEGENFNLTSQKMLYEAYLRGKK